MEEMGFFPKRRFKQFEEEWLGDKLDNLLELLKDGTHGTHKNVDKGIYLLSAKNIKNGEIQISEEERMISIEEYKRIHKYFTLKKGDVLLTIVGSIGESAIIDDPNGYTFQRSVAYLRPNKEINSEFLYAKVNSHLFQQELINRQVLSAQAGIYLRDLSNIFMIIPNVKEQQKIGEFFKILDKRIANQKRKIAKVKALKSAYLTEMFPQEGETVPKRRFKGFEGEWRTYNLGEKVEFFSGLTYSPNNVVSNDGTLVIRSSNIKNNQIIDADNVLVDKKVVNSEQVKVGDIIVVVRNGSRDLIGKNAVVRKEMPDTVIGAFMTGIRSKYYNFNSTLLNTELFKRQVAKNMGATINQITTGMFNKMIFRFPKVEEQQKIGEFFKNLDDQITTEEKKLEKLKKMKEAYLEEMFVYRERAIQ